MSCHRGPCECTSISDGIRRSSSFETRLTAAVTSHERLILSRQNLGHPHAIVHAVKYALHELPSREFLEVRVGELQVRLPRLNACVIHSKTDHPCYESGAPWAAKEIVQDGGFTPIDDNDAEMAMILHNETERFDSQDFDHSPMWQVSLLTSPDAEYGYLVACFNHLVVDGRGSLRLVHLLTARGINLPVESFDQPKRLDDTIDLKPDARYLTPILFREAIVPKLPKPLQKKFKAKDPWPAERVGSHPTEAPGNICFCTVPLSTIEMCKEQGKVRGVKTLHPILKMAYMAALWRVFASNPPYQSVRLIGLTSRDERKSRLGHSAVTGCYVTNPEYTTKISGFDRFWSEARQLSSFLKGQRGIELGRFNNGVLYHIPDSDINELDPQYDPHMPTGWERHWAQRAAASAPFRTSLAIHNLGAARLPQGAEDHAWSQTASPYAPVWNINVLTHEGGLRLSTVFRDGCGATKAQTDMLLAVMKRVLGRLTLGEADQTIAELTA